MGRLRLDDSALDYIDGLVDLGILSVDDYKWLLRVSSFDVFVSTLRGRLGFDVVKQDLLWRFVRDKVWDKFYFRNSEGSFFVFNSRESLVFDYLIRNGGVVDFRGLVVGGDLKLYDGMLRKILVVLEDFGLVKRIFVFPRRSLLVVNLVLLKRCFS